MQTNECFMCGGNDFTITDGAFVCTECGIQSQTIREEQINFNDNIMTVNHDDMVEKDHEIMAGSQLEKTKKLLSWECYNFILLGLTNEMIELGAKPSLKVVVLQLWVHYLKSIEAAFISKKFKKLPKLNSAINNIDCEILYGVENLRTKLLAKTKRKKMKRCTKKKNSSFCSSVSSALTASQKRQRVTRKLQRIDNSYRSRDSNNDSTGLSSDVSSLQRRKKLSKIKIKLTKTTKKSLSSMPSISENLTYEESLLLLKTGEKCWSRFKNADKENCLCIKKLVAIIHIALMINNDDIYLSDILRWIREGHLHVNRVNLFLPENVLHDIYIHQMMVFSSRCEMNQETVKVLKKCSRTKSINQLPKIDYKKLVLRLCDELQLPTDFTHFVCKLISLSAPSLQFTSELPDIEVKIMAYVLFAAKFLFCLDDNTENLSSDFAEKVNQSNKIKKLLFSWNSYVQYIECRNSVISNYIYSQHKNVYGNKIHNTELFINDWNLMMPTLSTKTSISKCFRDDVECLLKLLPNDKKKKSFREIPPSTKPLSSTLKWILEYYPYEISSEAKRILEKNFAQTDILYLTNEQMINNLADQCDIPIKVISNQPLHYVKEKAKKCVTKIQDKTTVFLSNQSRPTDKNKFNETMNNLCEEESGTIYLGTGLNYWFIDLSKTLLKYSGTRRKNPILNNRLPHSFQWFLNQCCKLLNCTPSALYYELTVIEKTFLLFLQTNVTELKDTVSDVTS